MVINISWCIKYYVKCAKYCYKVLKMPTFLSNI